MVSAGCAGLAGAFLGLSTGVVSTGEFPLTLSIELLAAMVLAGAGSLVGMWCRGRDPAGLRATVVYVAVRRFRPGTGTSADLATIIFGVVLIVVMMVAPTGIQGGLRWVWERMSKEGHVAHVADPGR